MRLQSGRQRGSAYTLQVGREQLFPPRRVGDGQAGFEQAPAADFATFEREAGRGQQLAPFFFCPLELAPQLPRYTGERAGYAAVGLAPGQFGPHLVGQRAVGSHVARAILAVLVAHHEQVIGPAAPAGAAAPGSDQRAPAGQLRAMALEEPPDGLTALVNGIAFGQDFFLVPGTWKNWAGRWRLARGWRPEA